MTTYCAPCLADLALTRDAVTTVNGTASCIAHAVLLTHPTDNPQRRLTRLSDLRSTAEEKLATASQDDVPAIELLIQEYTLAGAMDMTVPLKDLAGDRQPRAPKNRGRGRDGRRDGQREGGPREGQREPRQDRGPREQAPADGAPTESAPVESAPVESAPVENAPVESAPVAAPAPVESAAVETPTAPEAPPNE